MLRERKIIGVGMKSAIVEPPYNCITSVPPSKYILFDFTEYKPSKRDVSKISHDKNIIQREYENHKIIKAKILDYNRYFVVGYGICTVLLDDIPIEEIDTDSYSVKHIPLKNNIKNNSIRTNITKKFNNIDNRDYEPITINSPNFKLYQLIEPYAGVSLTDFLSRQKPKYSYKEILRLLLNVFIGIQKLIEAGLIHQDLHIDNIVIGEDGIARIIDFDMMITDESDITHPEMPKDIEKNKIDLYFMALNLRQLLTLKLISSTTSKKYNNFVDTIYNHKISIAEAIDTIVDITNTHSSMPSSTRVRTNINSVSKNSRRKSNP